MTLLIITVANLAVMIRALYRTFLGPDTARPIRIGRTIGAIGVLLVVAFAAVATHQLEDEWEAPLLAAWVMGVLSLAPIALVWRWPIWGWRVLMIGMITGPLLLGREDGYWQWNAMQILVGVVVLFVVGLREPLGVIVTVGLFTVFVIAAFTNPDGVPAVTIGIGVIMVLGEQIQLRLRTRQKLTEEEARNELLLERTRIARELHDVVAHSMSLVAVRAETAPYRLPDLPEAAREEFVTLAGTARDTLVELRRLLGVLRTEQQADRAPQPTLSDVEDLVQAMRDAGMIIDAELSQVDVGPAMGLTAYRIVQEALSNAGRHAQGARVRVTVTPQDKGLLVQVVNDRPEGTVRAAKAGHGLVGMRERVELAGGELHFGPTPVGGFAVKAVLP